MKKIEDNNTLVFIVDVRSNKRQISMVSAAKIPRILANKGREKGRERGGGGVAAVPRKQERLREGRSEGEETRPMHQTSWCHPLYSKTALDDWVLLRMR
jgi:hypothetical protein